MDLNEKILQRLDELITTGRGLISEEGGASITPWEAWRASAQTLVAQVAGERSQYYTQFAERATRPDRRGRQPYSPRTAVAILEAVRDDFAKGWLRDLRELAAAEVFTDFLDMAEHLDSERFHAPAASVAGAVLEDSLRRVHLKRIGEWKGESSISKLNDSLRRADLYGQAVWRQIQVWGDIRNDADHGHFEKVDAAAVKQMISGIRDFLAKHEG
ncbi:MAG TPA: hypothetical protein VM537_21525 [Anaerolineae bacterium]|nr:hypothetical protein [Anaerolineae bacterium]